MAISPWTKWLDVKIAPLPFEALAYGYERRAKKEEEADKLYTDLSSEFNRIGALDPDAEERNNIINSFKGELASVYDQHKDNPVGLMNGFRQVQRKFTNELNYGKLGGIKQRYEGFVNSQKEKHDLYTKYVESGGEKGLSPEDAQQYLQYEVGELNAEPIKQTPYGTWEGYKTETIYPTLDLTKKADAIGKEMREKPQLIEQFTGLRNLGNGYFRDDKIGKEFLEADAIEQAVINRLSTDPLVSGYVNTKNKISGKVKNLQNLFAQKDEEAKFNPAAYTIGNTTYNPETGKQIIADKVLNEDIYNAARTAGDIYKVNRISLDRWRGEDWQARDAAKETKERALYSFPLPAQAVPSAMENVPAATQINLDGSIRGGEDRADGNFMQRWGNTLAPITNAINMAIVGIFDPGMKYGAPTSKAGREAQQKMFESIQTLGRQAYATPKTKQELVEEQADKIRQDFPEVARLYPKTEVTKATKKGEVAYDANAGKAINFVHDAIQNSTAVIGNMMTPESPDLVNKIQKTLFNTNVFNKVTYKLPEGELGTKQEAVETLGFEDGVPQENLDKAVFNGYGGFLNPGSLYAQIPDSKGVPQDIIIEPDNTTKRLYTHSRMASNVFKNHKAGKQFVQEPGPNNTVNTFLFKYTPYITPDGTYSVKMEKYTTTPDGKEGTLVGQDDAMNVYQKEHINWLQYNGFTLK